MATSSAKKVLERAVADPAYRELLLTNPNEALKGYSLSAAEVTALKQITRAQLEAMAKQMTALEGELSDELLEQVSGGVSNNILGENQVDYGAEGNGYLFSTSDGKDVLKNPMPT
jgi:hypothetical protein